MDRRQDQLCARIGEREVANKRMALEPGDESTRWNGSLHYWIDGLVELLRVHGNTSSKRTRLRDEGRCVCFEDTCQYSAFIRQETHLA